MENKDILKVSSIVLTFILVLSGGIMSYWIYSAIISKPSKSDVQSATKIEINQSKLVKIQSAGEAATVTPTEGYGRPNPFLKYK